MQVKICIDCKQEKDEDAFYSRHINNGRTVYTRKKTVCKLCDHERVKRWRRTRQGTESRKKYNLAKSYNMTLEQWNKMLVNQDNKCAICRRDFSQVNKTPCVDHDHKTGVIRGLLCPVCNQFLGLVNDSPWEAVYYLFPEWKRTFERAEQDWLTSSMASSSITN